MEGCPGSLDQMAPKGFKVEKHEIYLFGKCKECAGKRSRA
jgi:Fur family ferric uptake transcriptional regulator